MKHTWKGMIIGALTGAGVGFLLEPAEVYEVTLQHDAGIERVRQGDLGLQADAIEARVAVEQASVVGWERYVGRRGAVVGMHTFGASAPIKAVLTKFGFTPEHVVEAARQQLAKHAR